MSCEAALGLGKAAVSTRVPWTPRRANDRAVPAPKLPAPTMTTELKSGTSLSGIDMEEEEERTEGEAGPEEGEEDGAEGSSAGILVRTRMAAT